MALVINKNAKNEYVILKTFIAGMVLSGGEVKSLRASKASLRGSFVKILQGEAFLLNAQINPYEFADNREYDPKRTRKLLLRKKEVQQLTEASQKEHIALVPLAIFTHGKHLKLELGIGRGKKQFEKRADLKKRAIQRDMERELKQKIRL